MLCSPSLRGPPGPYHTAFQGACPALAADRPWRRPIQPVGAIGPAHAPPVCQRRYRPGQPVVVCGQRHVIQVSGSIIAQGRGVRSMAWYTPCIERQEEVQPDSGSSQTG